MTGDETMVAILAVGAALPLLLGARCAWSLKSARYGWLVVLGALLCGAAVHAFYEILVLGMHPLLLPFVLYAAGWLLAAGVAVRGSLRLRRADGVQRQSGCPPVET